MVAFSTRRLSLFAASLLVILLLLFAAFCSGTGSKHHLSRSSLLPFRYIQWNGSRSISSSIRRLLRHAAAAAAAGEEERTNRIGEACSKEDIAVYQGATAPLPNGIPTYTVQILNESGCDISHIHLSCGWFSSARLINPRLFRRLHYNDCLVNNGKPLPPGGTLSFQYANSFRYPLFVSSVSCV